MALYVREDMNATRVFDDIIPRHLEVLWVRLRSSVNLQLDNDIFACVVYYPPRAPYQEELCTHIINMVDTIRMTSGSASFLIMGDFNDLKSQPIELHTLLRQIVTQPTRGTAVLDKIFTDMGGDYHDSVITAPIGKSDHMVISLKPKSGQISRQRSQYFSRPFRDSSLRSFGQWITQVDWSELDELTGTDMKAARFQKNLTAQYRTHFEQISIVRRPKDKEYG